MRKQIRFQPLGLLPNVMLHVPRPPRVREGLLVDESAEGFGIELSDAVGLEIGQAVEVEAGGERIACKIIRLETLSASTTRVGLKRS